jgi:hypothetical protein
MNAVRIRRTLDSETLYLPELIPLIGKNVEIIVLDETSPPVLPGTDDWDAAVKAVAGLEDRDMDDFSKQRE